MKPLSNTSTTTDSASSCSSAVQTSRVRRTFPVRSRRQTILHWHTRKSYQFVHVFVPYLILTTLTLSQTTPVVYRVVHTLGSSASPRPCT
jgi:hypothetical protein